LLTISTPEFYNSDALPSAGSITFIQSYLCGGFPNNASFADQAALQQAAAIINERNITLTGCVIMSRLLAMRHAWKRSECVVFWFVFVECEMPSTLVHPRYQPPDNPGQRHHR
jgi:hypothetical protein